tara:strand:+ start:966 stop:2981 length:2016 start_codon:yes stop_codon:yes gene_type:complete
MAWKKIIVQSSAAELSNINVTNAVTASHFVGDGAGLTNIVAAGTISSSAQIASDISGAFGATSSSLATRIANIDTTVGNINTTDLDFSGSFSGSFIGNGSLITDITVSQDATISQVFTNVSTSSVVHNFDSKNVSVVIYDENDEQFIPSKVKLTDNNTVTVYMDPATTGRIHVVRGGHIVSGSIPFGNIIDKPTLLSGSVQIQELGFTSDVELNVSSSALQTNIDTKSSITQLNASSSTLQSNIGTVQTNLNSVSGALATSITTEKGRVDAILSASTADADTFAEIVTLVNSVDLTNDNAFAAHYTASRGRLDSLEADSGSFSTRVTGLEAFSSSLDATYATDAELNASSSTLQTNIDTKASITQLNASSSTLQTSIDTKSSITQLNASSSTLQSNIGTVQTNLDSVSSSLASSITSLDTDFATDAQLNASSSTLQGNIDTLGSNQTAALNTSSSALQTNIDAKSSIAQLNASSSALTSAYTSADTTLSSSLAASIAGITSDFTLSDGSATDTFTTGQTLTFAGTANEIETAVTNNQVQVGIVTNPTLTGNVTITGNLNITGDTIQAQVSNLNVEDRFILLNSGSNSGDAGIVFGGAGGDTANTGDGIFYKDEDSVFAFGEDIASTATSATAASKLGNIQVASSNPTAAPTFQGKGTIAVNDSDEGIWIYS